MVSSQKSGIHKIESNGKFRIKKHNDWNLVQNRGITRAEESKLSGIRSVENIRIKAKENKKWKIKRIIRNIQDTVEDLRYIIGEGGR